MYEYIAGVLQGITEFLPVSSSGHLVILSSLKNTLDLDTYDIAFLHIGTLFSILVSPLGIIKSRCLISLGHTPNQLK